MTGKIGQIPDQAVERQNSTAPVLEPTDRVLHPINQTAEGDLCLILQASEGSPHLSAPLDHGEPATRRFHQDGRVQRDKFGQLAERQRHAQQGGWRRGDVQRMRLGKRLIEELDHHPWRGHQ